MGCHSSSVEQLEQKKSIGSELAIKFKYSYGVWTMIADFIDSLGLVKLQQLDKFMYSRGIQRVQICFKFNDPVFFFNLKDKSNSLLCFRGRDGSQSQIEVADTSYLNTSNFI